MSPAADIGQCRHSPPPAGSSGDSHSAEAILLAAGRALDSLPVAVANAVKEGTVRLQLNVLVLGCFICLPAASSWTCVHLRTFLLPRQCSLMAISSSYHLRSGDCVVFLPQPCFRKSNLFMQITAEAMQRYLEIEQNFFLRFWLKFGGEAIARSVAIARPCSHL